MKNKIVITGLGIISPIGKNIEEVYDSLLKCKTGIKEINEVDVSHLRNTQGGVVKEIPDAKTLNGLRGNILTDISVSEAIKSAGILDYTKLDRSRVGVSVGTSIGGYGGFVDNLYFNHDKKYKSSLKLNPNTKLKSDTEVTRNIPFSLLAHEVANKYKFKGPISSSVTACSASANALAVGRDLILSNRADAVLVVGVDPITQLTLLGFNSLMAMTKDQLRVMDENRSGLLIGEGAACIILEREDFAIGRDATVLAEFKGSGISNDAFHSTRPHPEATGAVLAIRNALKDANILPSDIDYINLHGTGTKHNDIIELKAVETVFGTEGNIPVSSTKSMTGHTLGAAGAIEAVISILALARNILPPNLNIKEKIKGYNYDIVEKTRTEVNIHHVLSNSFGFAGNCAALVFSRYK